MIERELTVYKRTNKKYKWIDYDWEKNKIKLPSGWDSLPWVQTKYIDTFGKLPNNKKNDIEWLSQKIAWHSTDKEI